MEKKKDKFSDYALEHMALLDFEENKSIWALLPIGVFILLYVGCGVISGDFYMMPATLAFMIALFVGLQQNKNFTFDQKLYVAASGAGDMNIITMCLIYLLAGIFSALATEAGGVTSTVNFALSIVPVDMTVIGLFLMGCFISISMGTSCGTIAALGPIAVGIADKTGFALPLCVGAVVCGAMFGDNLSMISDTTIAAVRTQGCEMRDKFKANFKIVSPAAVVAAVIFYVTSAGGAAGDFGALDYNLVQVLPYMFIFIGALCGINVFLLLGIGAVLSIIAGTVTGVMDPANILTVTGKGISAMFEISMIALIAACISKLVRMNGGFKWILDFIQSNVGSKKGAQFGIGGLVVLMDLATANNTIAIVLAAPLAKRISEAYNISAKRCASLMDTYSSVVQGLLPYGAQLMIASALSGLTPFSIIPYLYYPVVMLICVVGYTVLVEKY